MRTAFSRFRYDRATAHLLTDEFDRVSRIAVAEPVAVVIGCRFPGDVDGPESFWDFLVAGECDLDGARSRGTQRRLPPRPANTGADDDESGGGFVLTSRRLRRRILRYHTAEAAAMDPQQRMLLEVALGSTRTCRRATGFPRRHPNRRHDGGLFQRYRSMLAARSAERRRLQRDREMHTASRWVASPTCWDYGVRRSRWTPPARRRWWLCTWRVRV
ncbi:beta-ketoacyl synthase N-terminal-like domain-containing protein [Mycobacterium tuberculosis]